MWCWKNDYPAVPGQQRLMQDLDDWAAVKTMSYECQAQNFRLRNFMAILCKGLPRFDQMQVKTAPALFTVCSCSTELERERDVFRTFCAWHCMNVYCLSDFLTLVSARCGTAAPRAA